MVEKFYRIGFQSPERDIPAEVQKSSVLRGQNAGFDGAGSTGTGVKLPAVKRKAIGFEAVFVFQTKLTGIIRPERKISGCLPFFIFANMILDVVALKKRFYLRDLVGDFLVV